MMKTQTRIIYGLLLTAGLLVVIGFTHFYTIVDCWSFNAQTSQDTGAWGVKVTMGVDTKLKPISMSPLARSSAPYDLEFGFYTDAPETNLSAVVLERVTVQYENGKKVELLGAKQEKTWPFAIRRSSNWEGNGIVYHESAAAGGTITNCINDNMSFAADCQAKLISKLGEPIPITYHWSFQPLKYRGIVPRIYLDPEIRNSEFPKP